MHLVLTHEQADFDALAALYAAALLEGALPILPRRSNRNVRAFITLYGADFPFVDARDVPQGAIETVTLVDTQSLITLKGMGKDTRVKVYDHHPPRGAPRNTGGKVVFADWELVTFELGATSTYFIELLQERGLVLTPIQASLLLLGIYEDTGCLTYSLSTARDAHAVGWLLEQGAVLGIVTDFLNPALSLEQRSIYDRLVAGIESLDVNGQRVMLACGQALDATEEISTLAHKLRDLFDPDALFVLVETGEGVRFVARSATDQVDVAAIAAHFGGGGHNRAAAALIHRVSGREHALDDARDALIGLLPRYVRPAVTVAQLMSKRPRVLAAETPVQDAARSMAKYGYEGFPVVADGKVVGLLTRRAVDRATSHRLNLTAASLMEAGNVSVYASDSLQRLQAVMTESGWGQIPVVDAETHKVVGIVTRTDVLKMLSHRHPHSAHSHSLSEKLHKTQPVQRLALMRAVAEQAADEHIPVYIVGGFVRDLLLDHPSSDFDMVVEGDAIALGKSLLARFGGRLTSHSRFGTGKWYLEGSHFDGTGLPEFLDLISARQEFYEHPSALPTVEHGSIKLDLHRRDFTINTLALRLDGRHFGELHDYYGGLPDLERHLVRVLHSLSFIDDPTRMLRAVRYEQRYGFEIELRTLQLMDEARALLGRLSDERVRHEFDLILAEENAVDMLARLDDLSLLGAIADDLPWSDELRARLADGLRRMPPAEWGLKLLDAPHLRENLAYCLWLMDLSADAIERLHTRLCFPQSVLKVLRSAVRLRDDLPSLQAARPSQWVERLAGIPLLTVYALYLVSAEDALREYATNWSYIHPRTTGESLKARGLTPGPVYQWLLNGLRTAWLDGELASSADEDRLLEKLLKQI